MCEVVLCQLHSDLTPEMVSPILSYSSHRNLPEKLAFAPPVVPNQL
jgi:hypothetical protein